MQTIFLCVWQAVHLNIPPPGEPPYKQIFRRIGWSILAIIAPEVVALNAWLQYRHAKMLMNAVNRHRGLRKARLPETRVKRLLGYLRYIMGELGMLCLSPVLVADRLRMLLRHRDASRASELEQRRLRINDVLPRLERDELPWAIDTAFYALSGGGIGLFEGDTRTLGYWVFRELARIDRKSLLPLQRAVLQDPSKANGLAKFITCAQALWFCSQCIERLSQDMAISLLELNTFAHCVSAFFIYAFWRHKPYDVATHVYIEMTDPSLRDLYFHIHPRSKNMAGEMFSSLDWATAGILRPLIMFLTFLVYGAILVIPLPNTRRGHYLEMRFCCHCLVRIDRVGDDSERLGSLPRRCGHAAALHRVFPRLCSDGRTSVPSRREFQGTPEFSSLDLRDAQVDSVHSAHLKRAAGWLKAKTGRKGCVVSFFCLSMDLRYIFRPS